nr:hypothetical protein Iba_chr13fCG12090 [Ipomoea batatas]
MLISMMKNGEFRYMMIRNYLSSSFYVGLWRNLHGLLFSVKDTYSGKYLQISTL